MTRANEKVRMKNEETGMFVAVPPGFFIHHSSFCLSPQ
jgi:hypothetical protein